MSDVNFDHTTALNLANAALTAAKGGAAIPPTDLNGVYSYIFAVFALGAGLIPVVGPVLGSLCGLMGAILFPFQTDPDAVWKTLYPSIEALIGEKMTAAQVKLLGQKVQGFASNMKAFTRVFNDYDKAAGDAKARQSETLRTHHTAFLAVLRAAIPEFQVDDYAVASLPLFTQAANIHLALLSDGVRHGATWGFTEDYIRHNLQQEFDELTVSSSRRVRRALRARDEPSQLDALQECIAVGEAARWDEELLDTWREALAILSRATALTRRAATLTYPAYAREYYQKGRALVKPYTASHHDKGTDEALQFNALSDYDAQMIKNVLTYAEFWPYLTGKTMPDASKRALDREIFSGPYGRYTKGAAWDAKTPPPIKPRDADITAIKVRSYDDIDALQVQYGGQWGRLFGNANGGQEALANLAFDEYIQSVDAHYGQKLGQLTFFSNKDKTYGPYGKSLNAGNKTLAQHDGFGLTSMVITNFEKSVPPGTEGIIFGFRPLLTARA